jgi:hypothetical protein
MRHRVSPVLRVVRLIILERVTFTPTENLTMDRFLIVTYAVTEHGEYRVTRRVATFAATVDHAVGHWPKAWGEQGIRTMLASRSVGDRVEGPHYTLAGEPAHDYLTFIGDVGDLVAAAGEGPDVRVSPAGRVIG